jgi:glycosyltransferase involved in cell wall biosynthesis
LFLKLKMFPDRPSTEHVSIVGSAPATDCSASLLLEIGAPFRIDADTIYIESQAHHGVTQWLNNFDHVTVCAISVLDKQADSTMQWKAATDLLRSGRFCAVLLPCAYKPLSHIRHVRTVRRTFRALIRKHRYLCFSSLGWLGSWGRIGCEEAFKLDRPFAIWLDWVLHDMPGPAERSTVKKAWRRLQKLMLRYTSFRDLKRSSLALFNGKTVFDAYARLCKVPRVVHDVHLGVEERITAEQLQTRELRNRRPLEIIYVGRVHEMKGPKHWLDALEIVVRSSGGAPSVRATWFGGGPLLNEMRDAVAMRKLSANVSFPGPEVDRSRLLLQMRRADLFVFCHLTPESPRCLIEALMLGLPLVGFESTYARDLVGAHTEAIDLVPVGDSDALARAVITCVENEERLSRMTDSACSAGLAFSDVAVFKHRSDLIKQFL